MSETFSRETIEKYKNEAMEYAARAQPTDDMMPEGEPVDPEENNSETFFDYAAFVRDHPAKGGLKVQVSAANGAFPVPDATVEVSLVLEDESVVLYNNVTDESGIVDNMPLPALPSAYSQTSLTANGSGTEYVVSVYHPAFREQKDVRVTIFDSIKTILPIDLLLFAPSEGGEE